MKLLIILINIFFVFFTGKPAMDEPALSDRATAQREKWGIGTDELDYPVYQPYIDSLRAYGVNVHHTSRWFNGATVEMSEEEADEVVTWDFVEAVEMTRDNSAPIYFGPKQKRVAMHEALAAKMGQDEGGNYTDEQLALYNLSPLHAAGYEGQGILLCVCDGGFYHADTLSCFSRDSLELGHFDFTDDEDDFYGSTGAHGTECLSTISGVAKGYYGAATQAKYYLMRSEEAATESPKEMDNLVAALEKADSLGVNIFSVSLGYAMFDNGEWTLDKETELDGKSTRVSQAATIAARKGMLVCVAAGNEGNGEWKTISAPADADSVLTVGAVDIDSVVADFSSYGPSSDGRIKPEVCAVGKGAVVIYPDGNLMYNNGTSFATPLLAGMAASLWSALPDENAMQIRERIIRSAHRYPYPDFRNHIGYGIPDAWEAYTMRLPQGIENTDMEEEMPRKVITGDQILIIRHGHIYNLAGQLVR